MPDQTRYTICAERTCHRPAGRRSYFCDLHAHRYNRSGSATGHLVHKREIAPYRDAIAPVLDRFADHRAVVAALVYLEATIHGRNGPSREEWFWLQRLRDAGVTPSLALLTLAGVWGATIYLKLDDGTPLDASLGNALLRLVPVPRRGRIPSGAFRYTDPAPTVYRPLGKRIRCKLGPLLARLWDIYESDWQLNSRLSMALSASSVDSLGKDDGGNFTGDLIEAAKQARLRVPRLGSDDREAGAAFGADNGGAEIDPGKAPGYVPNVPEGFNPEAVLASPPGTDPESEPS